MSFRTRVAPSTSPLGSQVSTPYDPMICAHGPLGDVSVGRIRNVLSAMAIAAPSTTAGRHGVTTSGMCALFSVAALRAETIACKSLTTSPRLDLWIATNRVVATNMFWTICRLWGHADGRCDNGTGLQHYNDSASTKLAQR